MKCFMHTNTMTKIIKGGRKMLKSELFFSWYGLQRRLRQLERQRKIYTVEKTVYWDLDEKIECYEVLWED